MASLTASLRATTIKMLLHNAAQLLRDAGCDSPRLDAEVLWMYVSGQSKTAIIIHADDPPTQENCIAYTACIHRRQQREPVAYITGEKEFWSRDFIVSADVLIPRPETEHIIEWVLHHYPERQTPWHFADVGTGSGCIAVTLACEYPQARITAFDLSLAAILVAKKNALRHGVAERINFVVSDLLSACSTDISFDAIVSNPPYVSAEEMHQLAPELQYEPEQALTDHVDGLHCMRALLGQSEALLKVDGQLCIETGMCGYIQSPALPMALQSTYHDLAGHIRGAVYYLMKH